MSAPAGADVFIYTSKQAETKMQSNSGVWAQSKITYTDYVVIDTQSDGTADVWSVMTYKAKDPNGKTQNYYTTQNIGTLDFLQVQAGTKPKWIITGANAQFRIILTGDERPARRAPGDHGNGPNCSQCHSGRANRVPTPPVAATLTGVSSWDQATGSDRSIGTAKITMKLNAPMTSEAISNSFTSAEAIDYIIGILRAKNYLQGV